MPLTKEEQEAKDQKTQRDKERKRRRSFVNLRKAKHEFDQTGGFDDPKAKQRFLQETRSSPVVTSSTRTGSSTSPPETSPPSSSTATTTTGVTHLEAQRNRLRLMEKEKRKSLQTIHVEKQKLTLRRDTLSQEAEDLERQKKSFEDARQKFEKQKHSWEEDHVETNFLTKKIYNSAGAPDHVYSESESDEEGEEEQKPKTQGEDDGLQFDFEDLQRRVQEVDLNKERLQKSKEKTEERLQKSKEDIWKRKLKQQQQALEKEALLKLQAEQRQPAPAYLVDSAEKVKKYDPLNNTIKKTRQRSITDVARLFEQPKSASTSSLDLPSSTQNSTKPKPFKRNNTFT